jgi:hypothetical protein
VLVAEFSCEYDVCAVDNISAFQLSVIFRTDTLKCKGKIIPVRALEALRVARG